MKSACLLITVVIVFVAGFLMMEKVDFFRNIIQENKSGYEMRNKKSIWDRKRRPPML